MAGSDPDLGEVDDRMTAAAHRQQALDYLEPGKVGLAPGNVEKATLWVQIAQAHALLAIAKELSKFTDLDGISEMALLGSFSIAEDLYKIMDDPEGRGR